MSTTGRYLYKVKRRLPCSHKTKKEITQCLSDNIEDVLDGDTKVSYAQLCQQFGTPKESAASFKDDIPELERKKYHSRKIILWSVLSFAFAVILIFGGYFAIFYEPPVTERFEDPVWEETTWSRNTE